MPVQEQMSSFAKRLGGRVAEANAQYKDAPVDTGNRRLPGGIKSGVALLSSMYTKEYDAGADLAGETFFRCSAVAVSPAEHNGQKVAGIVTQQIIPLCDVPAKGMRKAKPFADNWFEFQNIFKLLGVAPCPETTQTDPTGQRTEAYFMGAIKSLTDPQRSKTNPIYIEFSTRGWTPPPSASNPNPDEMVFETWHGLAKWDGKVDPGAGVMQQPPQTPVYDSPPTIAADGLPPGPPTAAPEPVQPPATVEQPSEEDIAEEVESLVETAMSDPDGTTEDGVAASARLEEIAWGNGWTKEQTAGAPDWAAVGDMALNPPNNAPPTSTAAPAAPLPSPNGVAVGSNWMFAKRKKDGTKLKNNKGEEFPTQRVEVVTVDTAAQTCTVKTTKDGKDVVDIRSKKPVEVKFDWLEPAQ